MAYAHLHNPIIAYSLEKYASQSDWTGMQSYLSSLSHSQFRTASILLSQQLATLSEDDFWDCFCLIVPSNTKAYLMTFLKAAVCLYDEKKLTVGHPSFQTYSAGAGSIDIQKILTTFIPRLRTAEEVHQLLACFFAEGDTSSLQYLVGADTIPAYYCLFQTMRKRDYDAMHLRALCLSILRMQSRNAFNFVSIVSAYFGLTDIPARFSLTLTPYEHSRIENSYDNFKTMMVSI